MVYDVVQQRHSIVLDNNCVQLHVLMLLLLLKNSAIIR
jgi:hypothetical protein